VFDVCVVGSANLDLVASTSRLPAPGETVSGIGYAEHAGGKGLNQAVAAARAGSSCAFVGALGDDDAGARLARVLADDGIDSSHVQRLSGTPTGRAVITVDGAAENTIVVVPGSNALIASGSLPRARVVLAQLEIPLAVVSDAFSQARALGAVTILNPAPAVDVPDETLRLCSIVIPNEHERAQLGGAERLFGFGVELVITTLGADGVEVIGPDERRTYPAFPVTPVDTTGAGDAFCGAFAAALASGASRHDAVRFAGAAGALATTKRGAVPSLPTRAEIDDLLKRSADGR
jgi:ribokinase